MVTGCLPGDNEDVLLTAEGLKELKLSWQGSQHLTKQFNRHRPLNVHKTRLAPLHNSEQLRGEKPEWLFSWHLTVWQHVTWSFVENISCTEGKLSLTLSHHIIFILDQQSCVCHAFHFPVLLRQVSSLFHEMSCPEITWPPSPVSCCPCPFLLYLNTCIHLLVCWSASWEFYTHVVLVWKMFWGLLGLLVVCKGAAVWSS